MPSPSSSLSTQRPDLAGSLMEFDVQANVAGYVGLQVYPVFEVASKSGNFGKIPLAQLLSSPDTARAPGSAYNRGKFTFEPDTYACLENGHEEPVDDDEAAMYREYFDAEMVSAARARAFVLEAHEKRIAAATFNATTYTSQTTAITHEWDDATNAVPITDVESAVQSIYGNSGMWPNAMVINRKVFRNLRNVAQIIDRVKYQGFMDARAGEITVAAMAQVFDLDYLIVAGSAKNTAIEGQTASISPIWSDEYCWIGKVSTSPDIREPCVGRTFHWGETGSSIGTTLESYRDESVRSDIIRARMDTDEKNLYTTAGWLLSNVTT